MPASRTLVLLLLFIVVSGARAQGPSSAAFVENRGQWDERARYLARLPGLDAWVCGDGITYDLRSPDTTRRAGHVVAMRFLGARGVATARAAELLAGHHNYFIGSDRRRWASHVRRYREVAIDALYPGIAARLLFDDGSLRYDLHVAPGADASRIAMTFDGARSVAVDERGDLAIETEVGRIVHRGLVAYQETAGVRVEVECRFVVGDDARVGFELGRYDRSRPLVIDPIVWSVFVGSAGESMGATLAVDSAGSVTIAGTAYSADYPTTVGAYDVSANGNTEGVVTRLNPGGGSLAFSTYIGGAENEWPGRITIDRSGNTYAAFLTASSDFPTTPGAFDETANGSAFDIAIVKLAPTGASLVFSTYLGGTGTEDAVDIAVDASRSVFLSGSTTSADFPVSPTALYPTYLGGISDGFVVKLANDGGSLNFSTYLGGDGIDQASSIAVDSLGSVYVAGFTESTNFPTTPGTIRTTRAGQQDAFITKLNPAGTIMMYSTLYGGSAHEGVAFIEIDEEGYLYIAGQTLSNDLPVTEGSFQSTFAGQYVALVDRTASRTIYSTYLGGIGDRVNDAALARQGFFCLTGYVTSRSYPTTADAVSRTFRGGSFDAYVTIVRPSGGTLAYSTYLGGGGVDFGGGIGLDRIGDLYVSGSTRSADFPVTSGTQPGLTDFFVTKFGRCYVEARAGADRTICAGDSVLVGDVAARGIPPYSYRWRSSDTSIVIPDTARFWVKPTTTTVFVVMATDFVGCEDLDTVVITVNTPPIARAGADTSLCIGSSVRLGTGATGGRPPYTYAWLPATGLDSRTAATPTARPDSTMIYTVLVTDANGCTARDTATVTITRPPALEPGADYEICVGDSATLGVTIASGDGPFSYRWAPTTGLSSATAAAPRASPAATTMYRVTITDANGCSTTSEPMTVTVGASLRTRITASGSTRLCAGESITLDAGEFAQYAWSNGATTRTITVSEPGEYFVAITSATGCAGGSDTVRVVRGEAADARIDGPITACPGSTLTYRPLTDSSETIEWRAGDDGVIESTGGGVLQVGWLRAGSDTVTRVARSPDGCVDSTSIVVTIVQAVRPRIHTLRSITLCAGDTAVLDPGGSHASYLWSSGETAQTLVVDEAGIYWVDVVDSRGCTSRSDTVVVSVRATPAPEITALGTAICPGDSAVLVASAGFASYRWSNGATSQRIAVTAADVYSVTVTDSAGCSGRSDEVTVTVHPVPTTPTITVVGDTLTSSEAAAYQWLADGLPISGATERRYIRASPARYAVEIVDSNGCRARSSAVETVDRFVWADTASAALGERFRLGYIVEPPLRPTDGVTSYTATLRIDPRDLFAHGVYVAIGGSAATLPTMVAHPDGRLELRYDGATPVTGDTLFTIELQGLSTAKPRSVVEVGEISGLPEGVVVAGDGLVLLEGCDIGTFASGKRVRITGARLVDDDIVVSYRAPARSRPTAVLVDAAGRAVRTVVLGEGSGDEQEARIAAPSTGFYMIELRDRAVRSALPIAVTR